MQHFKFVNWRIGEFILMSPTGYESKASIDPFLYTEILSLLIMKIILTKALIFNLLQLLGIESPPLVFLLNVFCGSLSLG